MLHVATVLTACGIETNSKQSTEVISKLQQYLPLAVLKLITAVNSHRHVQVATVLTACGIETDYNAVNGFTSSH